MTKEDIAKATYQVNRVYCESLGDHSFGPWAFAPEWQKEANRAGVNFHLDHPGAEASASHNSWMAMKKAEGWKYGYKKDPEKKEQRIKDLTRQHIYLEACLKGNFDLISII